MREPAHVEILRRLAAFDTTSRESNLPAVDWLCDRLDRPGVRLERDLSEDGRKANLLVRIGPQPADPAGLMLCGHLDTVPAGEPGWSTEPFALTDRGDRWLGRGVCDMKGFVALATAIAASVEPARLRAPLVLLFTFDEEVGSLGAQQFAAGRREPLPTCVVVGEPTSLAAVRLHKGHLRLRLAIAGESAHGGTPHLGRNAIHRAARAVLALERLGAELAGERPPHGELFPEAPWVALNVGTIEGGAAVNVVPDRCVAAFGLRPLPGMDGTALVERARTVLGAALGDAGWTLAVDNHSPPLLGTESGVLHRAICDLIGQTGSRSAPFSSDAGTLQRHGHDCVLWGPGSISAAHRPDEWIAKDELDRGGELLGELVRRFCGREAA